MIYAVISERRIIRVYHGDLGLPGPAARMGEGGTRVREMAELITRVTGLKRPRRQRCMPWLNAVDFLLAEAHFDKAAVAARVAYRAESNWLRDAAV